MKVNNSKAIMPSHEAELSDFKQAMGPVASKLPDEEIIKLHHTFTCFANAAFDRWLYKRNAGLLDGGGKV
jgi:hypothetical protein